MDKSLQLIHKLSNLLGLNNITDNLTIFYSINVIQVYLGVLLGGFIYFNISDFAKITFEILVFCGSIISLNKRITYRLYERNIKEMIDKMRLKVIKDKLSDDVNIVDERITKGILVYCFTMMIALLAQLFLNPNFWTSTSNIQSLELPLRVWTPYYKSDTFAFFMTFVLTIVSVLTIGYSSVAVDIIFVYLALFLRNLLQNLVKTAINQMKFETSSIEIDKRLKLIINFHNDLLSLMKDLSKFTGIIIFVQCFANIIVFCILVFQMKFTIDNYGYGKYLIVPLFIALCQITEVFFFCLLGELLRIEAMKFSDELYQTEWYEFEPRIRKCFLLIMVRSQRETNIKAFMFFECTMRCFSSILKMVVSSITLLQSVQ